MLSLSIPLILASRSPRRHDLLRGLGVAHRVCPADIDENWAEGTPPVEIVERLASQKASIVGAQHPNELVLGADTIVVLKGNVLEKPGTEADAHSMLRLLSGATHTVLTGISLVHVRSGRMATDHESTRVTFADLTDAEIAAYVATGSPLDKAGGYGIQDDYGALFVAGIEGDYYNVVGLPLHKLYTVLKTQFADLLGYGPG